ncbi:MAG: hypothetical protein WC969_01065 [Elusimicrobiota bacterium]|jgi:hypothetical protein
MLRKTGVRLGALLALGFCATSAAQDSVPVPFMFVELRMAPFQGADAAQTRTRAETFLASTGYKVLSYQDNEAVRAVEVVLPPAPEDALARIKNGFGKMRLLRALRAQPAVSEVAEYEGGRLGVHFDPFVYRAQAEGLRSVLPDGAKLSFHVNPAMSGLWVHLDVSGVRDPEAAAREFARSHPDEVVASDIRVMVETLRIESR